MFAIDYQAHAFAVAIEIILFVLLIALGLAADALWNRRPVLATARVSDAPRFRARPTLAAWRREVQRCTLAA
jgi:hypothetical protein